MTILRMVLSLLLAVVLAAVTLGFDPKLGLESTPFSALLLISAIIGGPGFLIGGLILAYFVAAQEGGSMGPWILRPATLLLGIALGAANVILATFLLALTMGPLGLLVLPLAFPRAAVVGGVGLGLGAQIGMRRGMDG